MKVFITNLPFTADQEEIKAFLENYCPVSSVSLARYARDNKSRGFAFADLQIQDLDTLQGQVFNNKTICVALAVEKDKYQRPDAPLEKKRRKRIVKTTATSVDRP